MGSRPDLTIVGSADLTREAWDAVAVPVAPGLEDGVEPRAGAADLATRYGLDLGDLAELTGASGRAGEITAVPLPALLAGSAAWNDLPRRIVLVGIGDGGATALRKAGAALARAATTWGRVATSVPLAAVDDDGAAAFLEGALLASHTAFTAKGYSKGTSSKPDDARGLRTLGLLLPDGASSAPLQRSIELAQVLAAGTMLARELTATPAAVATPAWIAERASEASEGTDVEVTVHDEAWLAQEGFGGILAVGAGAQNPPRLLTLVHDGREGPVGSPTGPTVVVVGKGISYDTGGLALKPRESMVTMQTDMAGTAVAVAVALTAARLGLPLRVVAVGALAENAFDGGSYRPGDVVTTWDGTTVEIGNTDAEGRMVLADAISWARETWQPDVIVDVATLTGAAKLALGMSTAALFTPQDDLAAELVAAAERAGEPLWRMPLVADYWAALDSDVADLCHIQTDAHVKAGAVVAALFLEHFAGSARWAHLDIAGPARSGKARHELPQGATGYGVRLLTRWLQELASS